MTSRTFPGCRSEQVRLTEPFLPPLPVSSKDPSGRGQVRYPNSRPTPAGDAGPGITGRFATVAKLTTFSH